MYIRMGRYPDEDRERDVDIVIHNYDTWNMDHTLALLIVPLLKQLRDTKHGAPNVDNEDVPIPLRTPEEDVLRYKEVGATDENFFKRWDWVMDEMIWTFEQVIDDYGTDQFYDHSECNPDDSIEESAKKLKIDRVGLQKHDERVTNGLRLFGKYYRSLWD